MLEILTRVSVNGVANANGIVLNTAFMSELQTVNSTQCKFKFYAKPEDRRGGKDDYIVAETLAAVRTGMNTAFNTVAITLNVFPDNNASETSVATVFKAAEIIMAYPNSVADRTKCWIEVNEKAFKARKYLVEHYYVDISALAETGTTTTTSTTTTSTTT